MKSPDLTSAKTRVRAGSGLGAGLLRSAVLRQHAGVQTVRLRQLAQGTGEIADLSGIRHSHRNVGRAQGNHEGNLISTGCLQHHQARTQLLEPLDQRADACFIVRATPSRPSCRTSPNTPR